MNNNILYGLTVLIWGTTWIAINYQLGNVAPEVSVVYRFALASLILFSWAKFKKLPLNFSLRYHLNFIGLGVTLFGINYFLLYNAQQHINSALAATAFSTLMIFNIINARFWYKTPIGKQVYLGAGLGLVGIVTLFWPQITSAEYGQATLLGLGLCLVGTLSASMGNMVSIKNQQLKLPVLQTNAWAMMYGSIFMTFVAVFSGDSFTFDFSFAYISSLIYLALFGSVIAFGCYLTLMTRIGAHKTSYANILFPAVAVVISTFVEDFQWSIFTVVGFGSILLGNLVILTKPKSIKKTEKITATA
ncbi:MAG: EamA family transporter [Alteromonadaceae bacterium]|nr:EamA family transporter [Alteromonadaceae bacterium]